MQTAKSNSHATTQATDHSKLSAGARRQRPDALTLLKGDHRSVDALLRQYEAGGNVDKKAIARSICAALTVHAQIEEEILYPAAREFLDGDDVELVNEADVEHEGIKELIEKLELASPEDEHFDAMVRTVGEYVKHHVKEEESALFPKLRRSDMDLKRLGEQLAARKAELTDEAN